METPYTTPPNSEKFSEEADAIARRDLKIPQKPREEGWGRANWLQGKNRADIYKDRPGANDRYEAAVDLPALARAHYEYLLNKITPDETGRREFSSPDMKSGSVSHADIIAEMIKQGLIRETGKEIPIKAKPGKRKIYEVISAPAEEIYYGK